MPDILKGGSGLVDNLMTKVFPTVFMSSPI